MNTATALEYRDDQNDNVLLLDKFRAWQKVKKQPPLPEIFIVFKIRTEKDGRHIAVVAGVFSEETYAQSFVAEQAEDDTACTFEIERHILDYWRYNE